MQDPNFQFKTTMTRVIMHISQAYPFKIGLNSMYLLSIGWGPNRWTHFWNNTMHGQTVQANVYLSCKPLINAYAETIKSSGFQLVDFAPRTQAWNKYQLSAKSSMKRRAWRWRRVLHMLMGLAFIGAEQAAFRCYRWSILGNWVARRG